MTTSGAVGDVRALFPEVAAAVQQYEQAKPDRESRSLARRLGNEEAMYDQFVRRLEQLMLSSSSTHGDDLLQSMHERIGVQNATSLRNRLEQMQRLLTSLRTDLTNSSRGTEVLAKLKTRKLVSRNNVTISPMQKRLDEISSMNRSLAIFLCDEIVPLPRVGEMNGMPDFKLHLWLQRKNPIADLPHMGDSYVCTFNQVIDWDVSGRPGDPVVISDNWLENVSSAHKRPRPISISVRYINESREEPLMTRQNIQSSRKEDERDTRFYHHSHSFKRENKPFHLMIKESKAGGPVIGMGDMLKRRGSVIDQKKRIELAFRLSFALLILSSIKWAQHSSEWVNWAISFDADEGDELSTFFLSPGHGHEIESLGEDHLTQTTFLVLNREPVLVRLGICLIELALGQTLADVRQDDHNLWGEHEDTGYDLELLDLLTAKRLLSSRRIRQEVSKEFEGVVIACVDQQYRELKGARIKTLNPTDDFFLERATAAILLPLYEELKKSFGHNPELESAEVEVNNVRRGDDQQHIMVDKTPAPITAFTNENLAPGFSQGPEEIITGNTSSLFGTALVNPADVVNLSPDDHFSHSVSEFSSTGENVNSHGSFYYQNSEENHVHPTFSQGFTDAAEGNKNVQPVLHRADETWEMLKAKSGVSVRKNVLDADADQSQPLHEDSGSARENPKVSEQILNAHTPRLGQRRPFPETTLQSVVYSDATSEFSYDTITATTESAGMWPPESPDEPPNLPEDHPFSRISSIAVSILMRSFQKWRQCGSEYSEASGSINRPERSKKRARRTSDSDEEKDDEADTPQERSRTSKKNRPDMGEEMIFACPFFKKDAMAHRGCCRYTLKRIRDVKQHLGRRHQLPIYCPRCFENFADEDARDDHARDVDCERRPSAKPEGITKAQKKLLERKAPQSQTPEQQWYGIFDILFPDHAKPQSPYLDAGLFQHVNEYQEFLRSEGPRVIRNILTVRGAVTWHLPNGETDMEAFQHRMIEEGIIEIFNRWNSQRSLVLPGSDATNGSTQSVGGASEAAATSTSMTTTSEEWNDHEHSSTFTMHSTPYRTSDPSWDGNIDFENFNLDSQSEMNLLTQSDEEAIMNGFNEGDLQGYGSFHRFT